MYISKSGDVSVLDEPTSSGLTSKRLYYDFDSSEELNEELLEDNLEREKNYEERDDDDTSKWKSKHFKPKIGEFIGKPGLKISALSNNKFEWLELFLMPELVEHIVTETNWYVKRFFFFGRNKGCSLLGREKNGYQ